MLFPVQVPCRQALDEFALAHGPAALQVNFPRQLLLLCL